MAKNDAVSFRLTDEDVTILLTLCKKMGVSRTDIVRIALRLLAQREGVKS